MRERIIGFVIGLVVVAASVFMGAWWQSELDSQAGTSKPTVIRVTETVSVPSPTAEPTEAPVPSDAKYGQALQLSEGLKVTVLNPTVYPKDPPVKMLKKHYKIFTVTVKNTTKTTIPRVQDWMVDSGTDEVGNWKSGNGEFTTTEGSGMPTGHLKSGGVLTFTVVFGYDSAEVPKFSFATCPLDEICRAYVWA